MNRTFLALALLQLAPCAALADDLSAAQAAGQIGQGATICDTVTSVTSSAVLPGRPTFLNFGRPYPNQDFTVVIWGNQRDQVRPDDLAGKRVCVKGAVSGFQGKPEMYLQSADQLQRQKPKE
jgi:hypothetical protein